MSTTNLTYTQNLVGDDDDDELMLGSARTKSNGNEKSKVLSPMNTMNAAGRNINEEASDGEGTEREVVDRSGAGGHRGSQDTDNDVIFTPTSTAMSSSGSSSSREPPTMDPSPEMIDLNDYRTSHGLVLAKIGNLSKDLIELKRRINGVKTAAVADFGPEQTTTNIQGNLPRNHGVAGDDEDGEPARMKTNHRSSLASLAELHRTEITNITTSHQEEIQRLEQNHLDEMRSLRRGNGSSSDLVRGLHESYAKQIENLVLDLNESRRETRELKMKKSSTASFTASSSVSSLRERPEYLVARKMDLILNFDNLDKSFSTVRISIQHPGPTFKALLRFVTHAVKNHFTTLNAATEYFTTTKAIMEARKIRHWYHSAVEERIRFRFLHGLEGEDMKELWEQSISKGENTVLNILCASEAWETAPVFGAAAMSLRSESVTPPEPKERINIVSEDLVQVESPTEETFNPTAELERINRELGDLEIHESFQRKEVLMEDDESRENNEPPKRKRTVTVEEIPDEQDPYRGLPQELEDEGVGLVISSPQLAAASAETQPLVEPLAWEEENRVGSNSGSSSSKRFGDGGYLARLLQDEVEKLQESPPKQNINRSDSWLYHDIFSPLPANEGKGKEKIVSSGLTEGSSSTSLLSRNLEGLKLRLRTVPEEFTDVKKDEEYFNKRTLNSEPTEQQNDSIFGDKKPKWAWTTPLDEDSKASASPSKSNPDVELLKRARQFYDRMGIGRGASWLERLREEESEEEPHSREAEKKRTDDPRENPSFFFLSPAPPPVPPAPESSSRKSPVIPAYLHEELENTCLPSDGMDDDSEVDDADMPIDLNGLENPFSDLKSPDSPMMETARSVVSSTPLLKEDSARPSSMLSRSGLGIPLDSPKTRRPQVPYAPNTKPPGSSHGKQQPSARFNGGYGFPNVDETDDDEKNTIDDPYETATEDSSSTVDGWEPGMSNKKCGRGKGPEAYTWRRNATNESFRSGSISPPIPPPSRSSSTTTIERNSEFILPPSNYQQNAMGSSNGSNLGTFRCLRPSRTLGSMSMASNPHLNDAFRQERKRMNEMFAANFAPRANAAPPFVSVSLGPVFAPNPPHTQAMQNFNVGPGPLGSPFVNTGSSQSRLQSEGNTPPWGMGLQSMQNMHELRNVQSLQNLQGMGMHPHPHPHQHQLQHPQQQHQLQHPQQHQLQHAPAPANLPHAQHMWNTGNPDARRRSYSTDSISPLLWKADARHPEGVMQQQSMRPMMPTHSEANMEQAMSAPYPGPISTAVAGPWAGFQQPGTPHRHAQGGTPGFWVPQGQQHLGAHQHQGGFEVPWGGPGMMGMGAGMNGNGQWGQGFGA
ncbi:hypothetical protein RUND412_003376 [Rhizina undulata]